MSKIKGKDTGPEILVRKFLHNCGFRYRLHSKKLPGKPDIVLKKLNTIIDVRGCFWHGHKNCKFGDQVRSESIGINERIKSAIERDRVKMEKWKNMGWRVIVLWDSCQLEARKKRSTKRDKVFMKLKKTLNRI